MPVSLYLAKPSTMKPSVGFRRDFCLAFRFRDIIPILKDMETEGCRDLQGPKFR